MRGSLGSIPFWKMEKLLMEQSLFHAKEGNRGAKLTL